MIARKATYVFLAWILWANGGSWWMPIDGYESLADCHKDQVAYIKTYENKNTERIRIGKDVTTHSCFPSDFDPRERREGTRVQ